MMHDYRHPAAHRTPLIRREENPLKNRPPQGKLAGVDSLKPLIHIILPELQAAVAESPESPTAKRMALMIGNRLALYDKLMEKQGLTQEGQDQLLKKVADFSDY